MKVDRFDFDLPEDRIARRPVAPRDAAKMLVVDGDAPFADRHVRDLPDLLRAGDVLLVLAGPDFAQQFREHRDFAVVAPLNQDRPIRRERTRVVEFCVAALIVLAGTGLLDLLKASLIIAFALIVSRVVTLNDARRFVNVNVLLLMATSFALGLAVEESGLAATLANLVVNAAAPLGSIGLLAAIIRPNT